MARSWTGDNVGGDKIQQLGNGNIGAVHFSDAPQTAKAPPPRPPNNVLMLMSNPDGTSPLRLLDEHRLIDQAIRNASYRDRLRLVASASTRYYDLQAALPRYRPIVVHFSGHGSGTGGIVLSDRHGDPLAVPPDTLADTLRILGGTVRCVVLNACFTRPQAEMMVRHVPCVVGTSHLIADELAIEFACGFYAAAANGESVATAFELGRNLIDLGGRWGSDELVLIDRPTGLAHRTFLHN